MTVGVRRRAVCNERDRLCYLSDSRNVERIIHDNSLLKALMAEDEKQPIESPS
jgi:hypothetical protein